MDESLFIEAKPNWWNNKDDKAIQKHKEYVRLIKDLEYDDRNPDWNKFDNIFHPFLKKWIEEWNCRRCKSWLSSDGVTGNCYGPEIQCGETSQYSCCEQWWGRGLKSGECW